MSRTIEFRAWDEDLNKMLTWDKLKAHQMFMWPKNVMQFTGLLDTNGKEIYEGDIMAPKWIVKWDDDSASFVLIDDTIGFKDLKVPFGKLKGEVIGNIYENEELLR